MKLVCWSAALALVLVPCAMPEEGFTPLFDGKTLKGWKQLETQGAGYVVENGNIVCSKEGGGKLFTEREYSNFIFRFEFRLEPDGNNGVAVRAPLVGHTSTKGLEIQIIDISGPLYSKAGLRPEQLQGAVYDLIPARTGFLKKPGEWNEEEIMADGRRIKVTLNGVIILDTSLDIIQEPAILKKHPGVKRTRGYLGFLGHESRMEFRNIRVKELPN